MEASPAWPHAWLGPSSGLSLRTAPIGAPASAVVRPSRPPPASGGSLPAAAVALIAAAAWCRPAAGRRGTGRIVVYGRNYETNIKKKKGPAELRKARITRKHLNKIVLAVREFGPDEETNPALKREIRLALKDDVPRSTIERRIKKFVEEKEVFTEMTLGGYGLGGIAVMVQCATDSNIRARNEVREAFKTVGGQIGTEGCVDHLFTEKGTFRFEGMEEDDLVEKSMEADVEVEDIVPKEDGSLVLTTLPENFRAAATAFEENGLEPAESDVVFVPVMTSEPSEENAYELLRLLYLLQEVDDVNDVHHSAVLPEGLELKFNTYGIPLGYKQAQKVK